MKQITVLWIDDEIDLLKPHLLFLEGKGYRVITAANGNDALKYVSARENIDIIFLDEQMPGKSGLEVLNELKRLVPAIPVVMITKSEEENIMNQAIGAKIADYLIKPVNPNQILLTIKKNLEHRQLISEKVTADYRTEFNRLGTAIRNASHWREWADIYRRIVYWEMQIDSDGEEMKEILSFQKAEANKEFARYIKSVYLSWFSQNNDKPVLSPSLMRQYLFPLMEKNPQRQHVFLLIDNLRYDHWCVLSEILSGFCRIEQNDLYFSILPTTTQYARNALFAGLMPLEIDKLIPNLWTDEDDSEEESKNTHEEELLQMQMTRLGIKVPLHYEKILNEKSAKKLVDSFSNYSNIPLLVVVYNFMDALSHARTTVGMLRELAGDEAAYRSLIQSWFRHSQLLELIKTCLHHERTVMITTDHGSVRVLNPVKVIGDRETSANLRYKTGRNLNYNPREVFAIRKPADAHLPSLSLTSSYIFATCADFLVYPNNYNHYASFYRNTFQHGGISLEEMIVPVALLLPK